MLALRVRKDEEEERLAEISDILQQHAQAASMLAKDHLHRLKPHITLVKVGQKLKGRTLHNKGTYPLFTQVQSFLCNTLLHPCVNIPGQS